MDRTGPDRASLPAPSFLRDNDRMVGSGLGSGAWMLKIGDTEQSYVDLDDPTHLEFEYVQRIAEAIDAHAPAGERIRIVHIGGAGLTVARYVAHTRPTSAQIVLEPDEPMTEQVRERLPLPRHSGIKVRAVDGRSGIAAIRDGSTDVIVLDAFVGAQVPPELTTSEFLLDCRRVLVDSGALMINITDRGPFDYGRRVIAGVQAVFPYVVASTEVSTLKGRRLGNVVILAARDDFDRDQLQREASRAAFPYRLVHGAALTRLVAGALPFTDADAAPSPPPASSRARLA